jgi:hypothetical protein
MDMELRARPTTDSRPAQFAAQSSGGPVRESVLQEIAPALDERAACVLKINSGREVRWPSCIQQ